MKPEQKLKKTMQFMSHVEGDINANGLDYLCDEGKIKRPF